MKSVDNINKGIFCKKYKNDNLGLSLVKTKYKYISRQVKAFVSYWESTIINKKKPSFCAQVLYF